MKTVGPKRKTKELQKHDHCKQKNLINNARLEKVAISYLLLYLQL
jgi:hypothetical protein